MAAWIHRIDTLLPEFSFAQEEAMVKMQEWALDDRERRLVRAAKLAGEAAAKAPNDADVAVALADVLRLEKKPAAEVEKALAPAGDRPEALYVRGLLRARDGKAGEAAEQKNRK